MSADWWHIDMRDIVATLGAQFLINNSLNPAFAGNVIRTPPPPGAPPAPYGGPDLGPVTLVLDPNQIFRVRFSKVSTTKRSISWIRRSSAAEIVGRLTTTINGTWLSRAELQPAPGTKRFGIAGEFLPTSFTLTSSLPRNRANFSIFYDGPADTWLGGLDVGAVVHWIGQYEDDNASITGRQAYRRREQPGRRQSRRHSHWSDFYSGEEVRLRGKSRIGPRST